MKHSRIKANLRCLAGPIEHCLSCNCAWWCVLHAWRCSTASNPPLVYRYILNGLISITLNVAKRYRLTSKEIYKQLFHSCYKCVSCVSCISLHIRLVVYHVYHHQWIKEATNIVINIVHSHSFIHSFINSPILFIDQIII